MSESIMTLIRAMLKIFSYVCGVLTVAIAYVCIAKPIYDQALSWLRTGTFPSRDLHWAVAPVSCTATSFQPEGWHGMDLCREDYITFTGWIGLDQRLNFLFNMHIAIVTALCMIVMWSILMKIESTLGD